MEVRMRRSLWLAMAGILSIALPLAAQNTDIEALSGLQFNFANPGARSLGMGGAFLGLADDASAVEANPAGLSVLRKPEVSLEVRNYLTVQTLTTTGVFPDQLVTTDFNHYSKRAVITFGSFVYPIKNFSLAAYYHEPLNNVGAGAVEAIRNPITQQIITPTPSFFFARDLKKVVTEQECLDIQRAHPDDIFACAEYGLNPYLTAVAIDQRTWGVGGSWKYKNFSVGGTIRYQTFDEGAFTFRTDQFGNPLSILVQATGDVKNGKIVTKQQKRVTFATGFKWDMNDKFSAGGVYKQGARFEAPLFLANDNTNGVLIKVANTTFHMPDVAGLGVSVRPIPVLTINADAVHIKYSNLVDHFVSVFAGTQDLARPYEAKDVTELHLGGEYFFPLKIPLAIRAGLWRDPAHATKFIGPKDDFNLVATAVLFPGGKTQIHRSIGVGVAWPHFQVDAAYDTSEKYKVGSLSMVTRF
jgi:long-chain fatty acid transport protein